MGKLKAKKLDTNNENIRTVELTLQEFNYVFMLNKTLTFHTYGQKIISGFLYYVASNRLGYTKDASLKFELDLEKDDHMLTIELLPDEPMLKVG